MARRRKTETTPADAAKPSLAEAEAPPAAAARREPEATPPLLLIAATRVEPGEARSHDVAHARGEDPSPSPDAAPGAPADHAPVAATSRETGSDAATLPGQSAPAATGASLPDLSAPAEAAAEASSDTAPMASASPAEPADEAQSAGEPPTSPRSGRDVLVFLNRFSRWPKVPVSRAAAVAMAAALGAIAGAIVAAGLGSRADSPDPVLALQESVRVLAVEVRSLKAAVDASADGGLAALGDRLERSEKAQAALTAEIGKLASTLGAAPVSIETTGSVTVKPTGSLDGWVLWRVRNGRALVHGNGTYYEVVPGSRIPGLGVVQKIAREDGRWVVTTQNGQIMAPRG